MPSYADLVREAWNELYPDVPMPYEPHLKYSGKFAGFNGNIRLSRDQLTIGLSKNWRKIDKSIQKGLIQELIAKIKKDKRRTTNMDMYRIFLKHAHIGVEKNLSDPVLEKVFDKVNDVYFGGSLERPNLVWSDGVNRLGFYDYGRDQIALSRILQKDVRLLEYVMYHEMLHKKHKFSGTTRTLHHSRAFRQDEASFKDAAILERELGRLVGRSRWKRYFGLG
jgi:hypothetical protein